MSFLKQKWTLILYQQQLHANDKICITDDELHYLVHVLRLKKNDVIEVTNGIGTKGFGKISHISKKDCLIDINEINIIPKPKHRVHLILAQLKQTALEESIFSASELGVDTVHLFPSDKSVSNQPIKLEKLQKISNEAIRISKSAYSATIAQYKNLNACLDSVKQNLKQPLFLFCDETATTHIKNFHLSETICDICVVIGPEGSFSLNERTVILEQANCMPVSLGTRILRAQTAVICATFVICN